MKTCLYLFFIFSFNCYGLEIISDPYSQLKGEYHQIKEYVLEYEDKRIIIVRPEKEQDKCKCTCPGNYKKLLRSFDPVSEEFHDVTGD